MRPPSNQRPRNASPARSRRQAITEWRRVDLTELEKAREIRGRAVGDVLPRVLQGLNLERKQAESQILEIWTQSLDPVITAHAQPTGLVKGTLFISVDSNVWLDELNRYRRREILERLQHVLGRQALQKISFRLG
ncbi:MAG: hypothetical protein RLZ45_1453 [Verrucomicrobiota bacterium]|jgi:hypothetical protein